METLWFALLAFLLTGYIVLDGFDFGAGIIHLDCARTDAERRAVLASIGPVWDGNEVWLIAAGGTMFMAFPRLFASAFAGFYLPLTIVLWLLILRGIAIEFRNHVSSPVWTPLWDVVFAGSSALLALLFGVALGNVIRGVPVDANGEFFLPLWAAGGVGVLDAFTIVAGLAALSVLRMHGALWVAMRTGGDLQARAGRQAWISQGIAGLMVVASAAGAFRLRPELMDRLVTVSGLAMTAAGVAAFVACAVAQRQGRAAVAFLASCAFLAAMLASVAYGNYPYLLPAPAGASAQGITARAAAAHPSSLETALYWWLPGMALAIGYSILVYRHMLTAGQGEVTTEAAK